MQFTYGRGQFEPNSVSIASFNQSLVLGQNGRPLMRKVQLNVNGKIIGHDSGEVMSKLNNIYGACNQNYSDAGFPGTPIWLSNGNAIGGVIVSRPVSHQEVKGAEGITYIRWSAGFEANYPMAKAGDILAFSETVSFTSNDGLPVCVERIPVFGLPILQQVSTNSWYYATQQGTKTMAFESPDPLPMLFPGLLRTSGNSGVQVSFKSPDMLRGAELGWTTTWKYEYISALPFFEYPHVQG